MKQIVVYILATLCTFGHLTGCQPKPSFKTNRVLTLGIRNESNTFSTLPTKASDFTVLRGAEALKGQLWVEESRKRGMEFVPTVHAFAWPGGVVEQQVFDAYKAEIPEDIRNAGQLDGIYMDMHGALHVEGVDPQALAQCRDAGLNRHVMLNLGSKVDYVFGKPLPVKGKVLYLSPDSVMKTGRGAAVIEVDGVSVVLLNARRSFVTVRDFEEVGLKPLEHKIVVVKLGNLYHELRDMPPVRLMALTTGICNPDMRSLPFRQVSRPSYPLDPDMVRQAQYD
jgi:microcystin degradation protein MlrC